MVLSPPLLRLLLGSDPERHSAIALTLFGSALYLFNAGLIIAAVSYDYASAIIAPYMLVCLLVGAVLFYGLLRTGLSQRFHDSQVAIVGGEALANRYQQALSAIGRQTTVVSGDNAFQTGVRSIIHAVAN